MATEKKDDNFLFGLEPWQIILIICVWIFILTSIAEARGERRAYQRIAEAQVKYSNGKLAGPIDYREQFVDDVAKGVARGLEGRTFLPK